MTFFKIIDVQKYDKGFRLSTGCRTQLKTRKLHQVCCHLATTCYNKPISGCDRIACDSLRTRSLLQVVKQTCCKLIAKTCYRQACCKLLRQIDTSLQITSHKKPDFNRLVATWWNWQVWCNLLTITVIFLNYKTSGWNFNSFIRSVHFC